MQFSNYPQAGPDLSQPAMWPLQTQLDYCHATISQLQQWFPYPVLLSLEPYCSIHHVASVAIRTESTMALDLLRHQLALGLGLWEQVATGNGLMSLPKPLLCDQAGQSALLLSMPEVCHIATELQRRPVSATPPVQGTQLSLPLLPDQDQVDNAAAPKPQRLPPASNPLPPTPAALQHLGRTLSARFKITIRFQANVAEGRVYCYCSKTRSLNALRNLLFDQYGIGDELAGIPEPKMLQQAPFVKGVFIELCNAEFHHLFNVTCQNLPAAPQQAQAPSKPTKRCRIAGG